ncbi:Uncharacterised protein [Serratia marcescens]|nr:hypothetical protein SMQE22_08810 [Serratia marcescens]CAI1566154.1 Uncharacterised protein [Serratia marcescens]CAI1994585.1 Uncharacterised protein [Serratia marcescens]CAI2522174.1 Uncharacterised protein [Serratia marcescens]CVF63705.1 Uncharacterised protein [Serratia marcescens]
MQLLYGKIDLALFLNRQIALLCLCVTVNT